MIEPASDELVNGLEDFHLISGQRTEILALIARIRQAERERDEALAKVGELGTALDDLLSWFPYKPSDPEWRIKGGPHGADEAVAFARAARKEPTDD